MKPQAQNSIDLDKSIRDLRTVNLKLSRLLRELEEERRQKKKAGKQ